VDATGKKSQAVWINLAGEAYKGIAGQGDAHDRTDFPSAKAVIAAASIHSDAIPNYEPGDEVSDQGLGFDLR